MTNQLKTVNVDSSMIKTVTFIIKQQKNGTVEHKLRVVFNGDTIYEYAGVPIETYNRLLTAKSTGKAFNALIKDQYDFVQLTG